MLLTVRDSDSARAVRRAHKSSGRTTWILGDLGFPLADVCRVGTTGSSERLSDTNKCTEVVKGSIHDYVEGTGPPRSAPRMTQSTPKSKPTLQSRRSTAPRRSRTRSPRRGPENSDVLVSACGEYLFAHPPPPRLAASGVHRRSRGSWLTGRELCPAEKGSLHGCTEHGRRVSPRAS
jgi:hypothetical protein